MPDPNVPDLAALVARIDLLEAELARKDQIIAALQKKLFGSSSSGSTPASSNSCLEKTS